MRYSLVVVFGQTLDSITLEVFFNLYDLMMVWHTIHTDKMYMTVHEFYEMFYWKIRHVNCDEQLWNSCWKNMTFLQKVVL